MCKYYQQFVRGTTNLLNITKIILFHHFMVCHEQNGKFNPHTTSSQTFKWKEYKIKSLKNGKSLTTSLTPENDT